MQVSGDGAHAKEEPVRGVQEEDCNSNRGVRSWQGSIAEDKGANGLSDGKGRRRSDGGGGGCPRVRRQEDGGNTDAIIKNDGMEEDKPQDEQEVELQ